MAFEVYKPRIKKGNVISLTKNHIVMKPDMIEKLDTNTVELAYDRDTSVIRISPAEPETGFSINKNKIGARGFFKYFEIDIKGKYPIKFDETEKVILVDISTKN